MVQLGERRLAAKIGQQHAVEKLGNHLGLGGQATVLGERGIDLVVDATADRLGCGAGKGPGVLQLLAPLVDQVEERLEMLAGEEPGALAGRAPLDEEEAGEAPVGGEEAVERVGSGTDPLGPRVGRPRVGSPLNPVALRLGGESEGEEVIEVIEAAGEGTAVDRRALKQVLEADSVVATLEAEIDKRPAQSTYFP